MRPVHIRALLLRSLGSHYIRAYPETADSEKQIPLLINELIRSYNPTKHPMLKYTNRRNQERRAPAQEKRFALKETIRRSDRQRISFICRYVIGMKKTGIPLN